MEYSGRQDSRALMLLFLCLMAGDVRFARRYGSPATIHKPRDFVFGWIFSLPLFPLPKTHFARAMIPPAWGPGHCSDGVGAVTMLAVGAEKRSSGGDTWENADISSTLMVTSPVPR
jgi:hypothetical protein